MDENITKTTEDQRPVSRLELLYLIRAYNNREITLDEWMRLSREWAEAIIRQYGPPHEYSCQQKPEVPDQ